VRFSKVSGYISVVLAAACWGMSGIFVTLVVQSSGVSAVALAFWRDLSAFVVLLTYALCMCPRKLRVLRRDITPMLGMGIGLGLFHISYNGSVLLNGATICTVQQSAMPAIVAVCAFYLWCEDLGWRKLVAIALTFAGTFLSTGLLDGGRISVAWRGMVVGLSVPIFYACWTLYGKQLRLRHDALVALTYAFGIAALLLLPFQPFTQQPRISTSALGWFAGFVGFSTITPFMLYTFGLGRLQAGVAGILSMTEVVFAAIFARIILLEQLSISQIVGAILVVTGSSVLFVRSNLLKKAPKASPLSPKATAIVDHHRP
jgi:drug/metabolite transporter (DMT)-like permease